MGNDKISLLKHLDEEDKKIGSELLDTFEGKEEIYELKVEDVFGYDFVKPIVTIPRVGCGVPTNSIWSLLPLYHSIILPISSRISFDSETLRKIEKEKEFKYYYSVTPDEFAILAEKGRVIPHFVHPYEEYNEDLIKPFLEPGIPRISHSRMRIFNILNYCKSFEIDCKACNSFRETAVRDLTKLNVKRLAESGCASCLAGLYMSGKRNQFFKLIDQVKEKNESNIRTIMCQGNWLTSSRNLDSILQTNCPHMINTISGFSSLPRSVSLEYIVKGLKVMYDPKIPLETYLDIIDGKTSKAIRNIVQNMIEDPMASKYLEILNARLFEINRKVQELSKSKTAKIFSAVSDVVVYGGTKFIEQQSNKYIKLPEKGIKKVGEWLSEKGMDLESKVVGRDWEIAQLFRARCKLEKCQTNTGS